MGSCRAPTRIAVAATVGLCLLAAETRAQSPPAELPRAEESKPLDLGTVEKETVRLVLLDVIVLDAAGDPVSDMNLEDFEVVAAGKPVAVDSLDVRCEERGPGPTDPTYQSLGTEGPASEHRVALVLDYLHLDRMQRVDVLERARRMFDEEQLGGQMMLAALNGGLRIEQQFTDDREELQRSLHRMEYDVSLAYRDFQHVNEMGFVRGMTALLDVLGTVPGTKAVVLFSAMEDVPLDLQFQRVAALASSARCFLYPVDAVGLRTYTLHPSLSKLRPP